MAPPMGTIVGNRGKSIFTIGLHDRSNFPKIGPYHSLPIQITAFGKGRTIRAAGLDCTAEI